MALSTVGKTASTEDKSSERGWEPIAGVWMAGMVLSVESCLPSNMLKS